MTSRVTLLTSLNAPHPTFPARRGLLADLGGRAGRMSDRVRLLLGLRRTTIVASVRYTERSTEPLRRSLSRTGAGIKAYDAVFPDGERLRIHCTPNRVYADLFGPALLPRYRLVEDLLTPGMRVLDVSCGTGYGAAWLVDRVGPSGAVVALDRDRESIRYAQRRYPAANAAFEVGGVETLYGELHGGFNAVLALQGVDDQPSVNNVLTEMWRVVAPGGWLLIAERGPVPEGRKAADSEFGQLLQRIISQSSDPTAMQNTSDAGSAEHASSDTPPAAQAGPAAILHELGDPLPAGTPVWLAMKAEA